LSEEELDLFFLFGDPEEEDDLLVILSFVVANNVL
jgi:hypothetical protein